jgi:DNA-binding Lrp family transcriptional regulator
MELSRSTGLSIDIVKYRLKALGKEIISSYRAIVDINRLGYFHYVVIA